MRGQKSKPGDTRTAPNGYHYTCTPDGWKLTHRMIIEEELGRPLTDQERVKFIDGDRTNLDPANLEMYEVRQKTKEQRIDKLKSKIEDLVTELEELGIGVDVTFSDEISSYR